MLNAPNPILILGTSVVLIKPIIIIKINNSIMTIFPWNKLIGFCILFSQIFFLVTIILIPTINFGYNFSDNGFFLLQFFSCLFYYLLLALINLAVLKNNKKYRVLTFSIILLSIIQFIILATTSNFIILAFVNSVAGISYLFYTYDSIKKYVKLFKDKSINH